MKRNCWRKFSLINQNRENKENQKGKCEKRNKKNIILRKTARNIKD